jgi:two-component system chemotaxis sensor kinase CheA
MSGDDLVKDFLIESNENLDRLDRDLVELEKNPQDREALGSVFRTIHTIKGTCGFLGFNRLEKLAHVGENLLSRLRDGQLVLRPEITTALLRMVDAIRECLKQIESSGQEGDAENKELCEQLAKLQDPASPLPLSVPPETPQPETAPSTIGDILMQRSGVSQADIDFAVSKQQEGDPRHVGEILVEHGAARPGDVVEALRVQQSSRTQVSASDGTIRVDVGLLDKLMNLVGELVLARNQLLQLGNTSENNGLQAVSQRMNLIATELQEGVMKTRMQPIGNIWGQFPRIVRDVALGCGKQVQIEMEGKETELDKTIIEAIKDPLTHLVRNSVDHGIELPEERVKAGKDATGRLILRAFHEGGQVNIEITDDGAGLNSERIRKKAVERGVITAEQAGRMPEREIFNLVFLPGFSTAQKVTNISGRGVGLDVVKTNVEKIGGMVDIVSKAGTGTTVRLKIPLTLAIIPALIVTCGGERFAIPQVSLLELVRLEGEQARTGIETVQGAAVHRLRGRLLPLAYLSRELQLALPGETAVQTAGAVNIVVLQADDRQFGLVVDEVNDTEEIVVKPLSKQVKGINAFAGATIMGDGRVALILDVLGLAQRARVISEGRDRALADRESLAADKTAQNRQTLLLFRSGRTGRMAVPLSQVARLEEFPANLVEHAAGKLVVQYRGQIMPLIRVSEVLEPGRGSEAQTESSSGQGTLQVVVYAERGRSVGLIVDQILDIVDETVVREKLAVHDGILGSAVVQQRITDLLDVPALVRSHHPEYSAEAG